MKPTIIVNNVLSRYVTPIKQFGSLYLCIFLLLTSCSSSSSSTSDYQGGSSGTTPKFSEPAPEVIPEPVVPQAQHRSGSNYQIGSSVTYNGKTYKITRAHCPGVGNPVGCDRWEYDLVDDAGNVVNNVSL
jgi:hypothetical protein